MHDRFNNANSNVYYAGITNASFGIYSSTNITRIGLGTNTVTGNIGGSVNVIQVHGALVASNITTFNGDNNIAFGGKNFVSVSNIDMIGTLSSNGNPVQFSRWNLVQDQTGKTIYFDSGRVGVGTTTVDANVALSVNGLLDATSINFRTSLMSNGSPFKTSQWENRNSDIYFTAGNIGIGTDDPEAKLDVGVDARIGMTWVSSMKEQLALSSGEAENVVTSSWINPPQSSAEGSLHSIAWSPEQRVFVAVGDRLVMVSQNGLNWTVSSQPTVDVRAICWVPRYGRFVAVSSSLPSKFIVSTTITPTSISWQERDATLPLGTTGIWNAVIWVPELNMVIAVGSPGVMTKTNDVNTNGWNLYSAPEQNSWRSVCYSPQFGMFVAVAPTGTYRVMVSYNGTSWQGITVDASSWVSVCWSPAKSMFVAVADTPTKVLVSYNGLDWTSYDISSVTTSYLVSVCWSPELGLFVATSATSIIASFNGINWKVYYSWASATTWKSLIWSREISSFVTVNSVYATPAATRVLVSTPAIPTLRNSLTFAPNQMTLQYTTGNLGIGTTNPLAKTHIFHNTSGDLLRIQEVIGGVSSLVVINQDANVGIGTTTPLQPLHVLGRSVMQGNVGIGTTYAASSPPLDGLIVAGSIGIGTITPLQKIHVVGTSYMQGNMCIGSSYSTASLPTNGLFVQGAVGIGTSSVGTNMLQVQGTALISDSVTTNTKILAPSSTSATAPTYTFTGDDNTGIFNPSADVLGFATGGAERVRINLSGSVGIGLANPSSTLHVNGNITCSGTVTTTAVIGIGPGIVTKTIIRNLSTTVNDWTEFVNIGIWNGACTIHMDVTQSEGGSSVSKAYVISRNYYYTNGNWHICNPISSSGDYAGNDWRLDMQNNYGDCKFRFVRVSGVDNNLNVAAVITVTGDPGHLPAITELNTTGSGATTSGFYMGSVLTQCKGSVGIGVLQPTATLHVVGQILATDDITAFSDIRKKSNITRIDNALEKVCALSGYTFTKNDEEHTKRHMGVIAQEIENIIPEVVHTQSDGMMSVAYGNIVALLIEAIKELKERKCCCNCQCPCNSS